MKRAPDDIERAEGVYRICKGCGKERGILDYPDRACGNPERYCSACRKEYGNARFAEYFGRWMKANGLTSHRVLLVGKRRKPGE